jgi:methyl-accepting chemotaxis protein
MHPHLQQLYNKLEFLNNKIERLIMTMDEFTAQLEAQAAMIDQTKAIVDKVFNEVQEATASQAAAIASLQQEIVNSGNGMSEAALAALLHITAANEALSNSVNALDNINADIVAEVPQQ